MGLDPQDNRKAHLDGEANEARRRKALQERCLEYREHLQSRDPYELARQAALGIGEGEHGVITLCGENWGEFFKITWPVLGVTAEDGKPAALRTEALSVAALPGPCQRNPFKRAPGQLSEIGGLFYQQAFQGYTGDELARAWGGALDALEKKCRNEGGWPVSGLGDLGFEWRALLRLPVYLSYRAPAGSVPARATLLFDASSSRYVAADVAAILGKELSNRLMPSR